MLKSVRRGKKKQSPQFKVIPRKQKKKKIQNKAKAKVEWLLLY